MRIPTEELEFETFRSTGPGGQNVNKVASKVEMRVDLNQVTGLSEGARARLRSLASSRLDADGRLIMTSQLTRDQGRNLEDAREKVRALIAAAQVVPKARRPTRPSRAAKARRVDGKKLDAKRKANRGRASYDD